MQDRFKKFEIRQDEIYEIVRAIEHSNQVDRAEFGNQNIRIAKLEGKLKRPVRSLKRILTQKMPLIFKYKPYSISTPV